MFTHNTTKAVEELLPDHIQIARKLASEINSMESPMQRREALDTIKSIVLTQLSEEQDFEELKIEECRQKLESIIDAIRGL